MLEVSPQLLLPPNQLKFIPFDSRDNGRSFGSVSSLGHGRLAVPSWNSSISCRPWLDLCRIPWSRRWWCWTLTSCLNSSYWSECEEWWCWCGCWWTSSERALVSRSSCTAGVFRWQVTFSMVRCKSVFLVRLRNSNTHERRQSQTSLFSAKRRE